MQLNYAVSVCVLAQAQTAAFRSSKRASIISQPPEPPKPPATRASTGCLRLPAVCVTEEALASTSPVVCSSLAVVVCGRRRAQGNERARWAFVHDGCPYGVGHVERDARGLLSRTRSVSSELWHVIGTASIAQRRTARASTAQHEHLRNMLPFACSRKRNTPTAQKGAQGAGLKDGRNAPAEARQSCRMIGLGAGRWPVHATRHLRTLLPPSKRAR